MKYRSKLIVAFFFLCSISVGLQLTAQNTFKVIPLGVKGGADESNLSSYMLAIEGTNDYICLDAGTLHYGIQKAVDAGLFDIDAKEVLRKYVKAYLISHAHLDHVAGLIINSPDDSSKNIYGLPFCLDILKDKYFTWKGWANFTDEGDKPLLNKYHYVVLSQQIKTSIANTAMSVTAFPLSHSNPYQSTAFLINYADKYVLYLGDTGADSIERSDNLQMLWQWIAPLIQGNKLKGIFIETSFPNEQPEKLLFGHLTPKLLMSEMHVLNKLTGTTALKDLPIIITHIKPNGNSEEKIKQQLIQSNDLNLKLIFPEQAKLIEL
jgi:cAMP phosphodiesterase